MEVNIFEDLKKPFRTEDIEWRISRAGEKDGKIWALCLAYVTNRAIQDRLDNVVGPENWKNDFSEGPGGGVLCHISIKINDAWLTKTDGAENTNFEAVKGGLSGAMKRAAVQWGIGRYLYNLDETFAEVSENGKLRGKFTGQDKQDHWFRWNPPKLPAWALPDIDLPLMSEDTKNHLRAAGCNTVAKVKKVLDAFHGSVERMEKSGGFWNWDIEAMLQAEKETGG